MKTTSSLLLSLGAACMFIGTSVHAGVNSADVPKITNGSTGYIGLTESAGMPRQQHYAHTRAARGMGNSGVSRIPSTAGEASTMVNGNPNGNPDAPGLWASTSTATDTRVMGASPSMSGGPEPKIVN